MQTQNVHARDLRTDVMKDKERVALTVADATKEK